MSKSYWLNDGKQITGPFDAAQVREMLKTKQISPDSAISSDKQKWVRVRSLAKAEKVREPKATGTSVQSVRPKRHKKSQSNLVRNVALVSLAIVVAAGLAFGTYRLIGTTNSESDPDLVDATASEGKASAVTEASAISGSAGDAKQVGETVTNSMGMELAYIPAGSFTMGSPPNEEGRSPWEEQVGVTFDKPFLMGTREVTKGQFAAFISDTAYRTDAEKTIKGTGFNWRNTDYQYEDEHPVVNVSWNDAVAFCKWLSDKEGTTYRLPTSAEREYACRAGTKTAYHWGDSAEGGFGYTNVADMSAKGHPDVDETQRFRDGFMYAAPVGSFKPNPWGLYDMHGNVLEWCDDLYYDPYDSRRVEYRIVRGGCFTLPFPYFRSATWIWQEPARPGQGFRVVLAESTSVASKLKKDAVASRNISRKKIQESDPEFGRLNRIIYSSSEPIQNLDRFADDVGTLNVLLRDAGISQEDAIVLYNKSLRAGQQRGLEPIFALDTVIDAVSFHIASEPR